MALWRSRIMGLPACKANRTSTLANPRALARKEIKRLRHAWQHHWAALRCVDLEEGCCRVCWIWMLISAPGTSVQVHPCKWGLCILRFSLSMWDGCSSPQANRNRCRQCNLHPDPRPHHHPSLCWRAMHNSTCVAILARQENRSTLIASIQHGKQTSHLTLATISRVALVRKQFSLRSSTRQDEYMQRDKTRQSIYIYMYIRHEIHPVTRRAVVQHYIYIYIYIIYIYI